MSNILSQYLSALNSSAPALLLIALGVLVSVLGVYPSALYGNLTSIAFKVALPVKTIFTLSTQPLTRDDGILMAAIVVVSAIGFLLTIPIVFLYPKKPRWPSYAGLCAIVLQNNMVISGIPVFSGLYDPALVTKTAYLQILGCFGLVLPFNYIILEATSPGQRVSGGRETFKMVMNCVIKTVKQPVIIGVLMGLLGNVIFQPLKLQWPGFMTKMFQVTGDCVSPLGLFMLGMFIVENYKKKAAAKAQAHARDKVTSPGLHTMNAKAEAQELAANMRPWKKALVYVYIQLARHVILPALLAFFCRLMGLRDKTSATLNAGIFASPTAVLAVVMCQQYGFTIKEAGFDAVFGFISGAAVIPIIQTLCNWLWDSDDMP